MAATPAADEAFQHAVAALQTGNVEHAERLFKAVLQTDPKHVGALNLLGIVLTRFGRFAEAEAYLRQALQAHANSDATLYNHGIVLKALHRPADALQQFTRALEINPGAAATWNNRGTVFNDLKRHDEAISDFEKAIELDPQYAEAFCNEGHALAILKRLDDALAAFERAAALKPELAEAWLGGGRIFDHLRQNDKALVAWDRALALKPDLPEACLGRANALHGLKRNEEALAAYGKSLALAPDSAAAHCNRGAVLLGLKRFSEALASCERAIALQPDLTLAHSNHAAALLALNQYAAALASCDHAIALDSGFAQAHSNRGSALLGLNRYSEALASCDRAIELDPGFAAAHRNRGTALLYLAEYQDAFAACDKAFTIEPDLQFLEGHRLYAKQMMCNWDNLDAEASHLLCAVRNRELAADPFALLAIPSLPADQLQCAKLYVQNQPSSAPLWRDEIYSHDRIRVAYLSADFHEHATAYLIAGLFEKHDRSRFEITGISFGPDDNSAARRRIDGALEHFMDVRDKSDQEIAELIRRREIDIVVDLKGLTAGNRLNVLARRAAPIQVDYLGYPGTTGADYIDYVIADATTVPKDQWAFYTEKVVWLPDSYQVNDDKRRIPERTPSRRECGLPDDAFVFCCFNNPFKITPEIFDIWMRLLKSTQDSVLWLFAGNSSSQGKVCRDNLRREAEKRGIASHRLIFAGKTNLADHLARHRLADLFLDTLPYNAHTTASDALWAGLPVVTCLGATFAGRVAASLLKEDGLSVLVAA